MIIQYLWGKKRCTHDVDMAFEVELTGFISIFSPIHFSKGFQSCLTLRDLYGLLHSKLLYGCICVYEQMLMHTHVRVFTLRNGHS